MGMMLKTKRTAGHRFATFAALAQAALMLFWGGFASAQEGNRLQDIQVQSLPGDRIELVTLGGIRLYEISDIWIVNPDDVSVLAPTDEPSLTLVTCYPFYFVGNAPQRYIVRAVLAGEEEMAGPG